MSFAALASIGTAILGAKSQSDANKITSENNDLQREQFEFDRAKQAPGVAGAQDVLTGGTYSNIADPTKSISAADYGALTEEQKAGYNFQSQFQPFVDSAGQTAIGAGNIANQYIGNVPQYQQAGLAGLQSQRDLANFGYADQQKLAQQYANDYGQNAYNLAAKDINKESQFQDYSNARDAGRFGALSSQKARKDAYVEQGRTDALLQASERANQVGYDRSQAELLRQQQLATANLAAGSSGLSQATSAAALGDNAANAGINTPFKPFQAYNTTVNGAPSVI